MIEHNRKAVMSIDTNHDHARAIVSRITPQRIYLTDKHGRDSIFNWDGTSRRFFYRLNIEETFPEGVKTFYDKNKRVPRSR